MKTEPTTDALSVPLHRLVRLLDAVRTAKPWIKGFENMLASSLSSDSRSHDDDRQPRRDINAVLDALAECDKPNESSADTAGVAPRHATDGIPPLSAALCYPLAESTQNTRP